MPQPAHFSTLQLESGGPTLQIRNVLIYGELRRGTGLRMALADALWGCSCPAASAAVAGIDAERPRRHAIAGDGSVHESPKQLPSELLRILGLLQKLGLVIIPARSGHERARLCSATTRDRSRVAGCLSCFARLLPEQSGPRTRQPRGDRKHACVLICRLPSALAGCQSGTILDRVSPPRIGSRPCASLYFLSSHLLVRPIHLLVPACRT